MLNVIGRLSFAASLVVIAGAASAQWYGGAQGGSATGGPDAGKISRELVNDLGYFSAATSTDKRDFGWRVFAGYQMLPWLALEGAYVDVGRSKWTSVVSPPGTIDVSLRTSAWTLGLAARYEFVPGLSAYGRVSAAYAKTKPSISATGFADAGDTTSRRDTVPAYAAGIEYSFTPRISGRIEFERIARVSSAEFGGKFDVDFASVGIRVGF